MFDDGHLNEDPAAARAVMDDLMSIMTDQREEHQRILQDPKVGPLWRVFDTVWFRVQQVRELQHLSGDEAADARSR